MQSLKQTAITEQLKAELRMLVDSIEQSEFFADNGNSFEKTVARRYLAERALKARDFLNKINAEESLDKTDT